MPKTTKTLDSSIADLGNRLFREFHEALCQLNLIQTTRTACHPAPVQARGKSVPTFNGPWVGKSRFIVRLCKQDLQKVNDRKTKLQQPTPQRLLVVTAEGVCNVHIRARKPTAATSRGTVTCAAAGGVRPALKNHVHALEECQPQEL